MSTNLKKKTLMTLWNINQSLRLARRSRGETRECSFYFQAQFMIPWGLTVCDTIFSAVHLHVLCHSGRNWCLAVRGSVLPRRPIVAYLEWGCSLLPWDRVWPVWLCVLTWYCAGYLALCVVSDLPGGLLGPVPYGRSPGERERCRKWEWVL
jgi:hypothetical protein